jgi:hypothetical protein
MLDRRGVQRRADFAEQAVARRVLVGKHADFDQFMAGQILVDFVEHGGGQSCIAYYHDRTQVVGTGAQLAALR